MYNIQGKLFTASVTEMITSLCKEFKWIREPLTTYKQTNGRNRHKGENTVG